MIVSLEEMKDRLSIDFATKDDEITGLIKAAEAYLYFATGFDFNLAPDAYIKDEAREWVFLRVYLDYYMAHDEMNDQRLTAMMKQLQLYPCWAYPLT